MAEEIKFADGMGLVDPKPNTPSFVLNKFYFNADKFSQFLQENKSEKGWVYVDMLMSQKGAPYFKLNNFKPKEEKKEWKPAPQSQKQIDEMKNLPQVEYPEESPEESPF